MTFRAVAILLFTLLLAAPLAAEEADPAYTVDRLNPGLGPVPVTVDRSTPRATMESLLYLAERDQWQDAAHLLDLTGLPEFLQAARGAELARKLETVISRKAVINWDMLLDRPDALDAEAPDREVMAGKARKSILLWQLDLGRYPASIRLNRVQPATGPAVWVFSRQTVGNIDALFDRYGPSALELALPPALRDRSVFGLMLWELAALPILIGLAVLAGLATRRLLDRLSNRMANPVLRAALRAIRGPAIFGAVVGIAWAASRAVFVFSGGIDTILSPLIWIGILGSALWLVVNAIDAVLDRIVDFGDTDLTRRQEKEHRVTATRIAAARRAIIVVVVLLGAGIFVSSTNLFDNLGLSMLGTAGALTLILGFAARRVLGNIMSSLQIALNQSARLGDRVVYKDRLCHVERINFTYVQLRDWDGTRLVVPVEEFASTEFENWTLQEPEMLRIIKLKLAHDVEIDPLREAFAEVIDSLDPEELDDLDKASVRVADQDVFGTEVWFSLPCADPNTSWDMACLARERLLAKIAEIGARERREMFPEANPAEAA